VPEIEQSQIQAIPWMLDKVMQVWTDIHLKKTLCKLLIILKHDLTIHSHVKWFLIQWSNEIITMLILWNIFYHFQGYAYVPRGELSSIISNVFRTHLSHALAVSCFLEPVVNGLLALRGAQ